MIRSLALCNISDEKRSKSDYQRVWQGILIGYSPDTIKHFRVWAPQTRQVVIASEPYIDEPEKGAKLPSKWPLETATRSKKKAPAGEPRPKGRPQKQIATEITTPVEDQREEVEEVAMSMTESSSKRPDSRTSLAGGRIAKLGEPPNVGVR